MRLTETRAAISTFSNKLEQANLIMCHASSKPQSLSPISLQSFLASRIVLNGVLSGKDRAEEDTNVNSSGQVEYILLERTFG